MRFWAMAALLAALSIGPVALAQAPEGDEAVYTDSCFVRKDGSTRGQAVQITRSAGTFKVMYQDFREFPHPPEPGEGQIAGDKLTFDVKVVGLAVHFTGTITPQAIKGRFSNTEDVARYNAEVVWPKLPPKTLMPDCL